MGIWKNSKVIKLSATPRPFWHGESFVKRITILWSFWSDYSDYIDACVRALVEEHDCFPTIVYRQHGTGAPYTETQFFQLSPFHKGWGAVRNEARSEPCK
jgi:hypothetical protein